MTTAPAERLAPTHVIRTTTAEWARIWSVRSSWILAAVTTAAVLGFGGLVGYSTPDDLSTVTPGSTAWDGGQPSALLALFGILAFAAVTGTADYGNGGGISTTLQWTPQRKLLLLARCGVIVLTATALATGVVAGAALMVRAFIPGLALTPTDALDVLGGLAVLFACATSMTVGFGFLLRSTAGTLVTVIALVLVLPMLFAQLGYTWSTEISARLPGSSALYLIFGEGPSNDMSTTSARTTLAVWALGALSLGSLRLLRTDANR